MKFNKWSEKVDRIFEEMANEKTNGEIFFQNMPGGAWFCDKKGVMAYRLEGQTILSAKPQNAVTVFEYLMNETKDAAIAIEKTNGITKEGHKVCRLSRADRNRQINVYLNPKLMKKFPANTLYYTTAATKAVLAGIWENDKLHIIGLIMPVRVNDGDFAPEVA